MIYLAIWLVTQMLSSLSQMAGLSFESLHQLNRCFFWQKRLSLHTLLPCLILIMSFLLFYFSSFMFSLLSVFFLGFPNALLPSLLCIYDLF